MGSPWIEFALEFAPGLLAHRAAAGKVRAGTPEQGCSDERIARLRGLDGKACGGFLHGLLLMKIETARVANATRAVVGIAKRFAQPAGAPGRGCSAVTPRFDDPRSLPLGAHFGSAE